MTISHGNNILYICSRISKNIGIISNVRHHFSVKQFKQLKFNFKYPADMYHMQFWHGVALIISTFKNSKLKK